MDMETIATLDEAQTTLLKVQAIIDDLKQKPISIEQRRAALSEKIDSVFVEFNRVKSQIEEQIEAKVRARKSYDDALDHGREDKMKNALQIIQQSGVKVEELNDKLCDFPSKVAGLRTEWQGIADDVRSLRKPAEDAMNETKDIYQFINRFISRCAHGLLEEINGLDKAMSRVARPSVGR